MTIDGATYTPSGETVRWKAPPSVNVENEYEVTLYDDEGTAYRMVGVSITQGYATTVEGVTFEGVLGNRRALLVSPNHRIFLRSILAELHFGHHEALAPAKALTGLAGIARRPKLRAPRPSASGAHARSLHDYFMNRQV